MFWTQLREGYKSVMFFFLFFFPEAGAHPQPREQNSKGAVEVCSAGETKVGSQ